jgi:Polysaccharide pyruvyl transferase
MSTRVPNPVILVGAFERHNFGDLLMGRVVASFLRDKGMTPIPASILPSDLRRFGGLRVHGFGSLAGRLPSHTPIVHVGGETLSMGMETALRMDVPAGIQGKLAADLSRMIGVTGLDDREFAYLTPRSEHIQGVVVEWRNRYFHALGGHQLQKADEAIISKVTRNLKEARWLTVRDSGSMEALRGRGLDGTRVVWDAGVLAGDAVTEDGPVDPGSGPYLLVQMGTGHFDSMKAELIGQISALREEFPKVIIAVAGVAAKHDCPEASRDFAGQLRARGVNAEYCPELELGKVVGLIRGAACVLSSSLHFRMVALAHAVPRVSLALDKLTVWAREHDPDYPSGCAAGEVAEMVRAAMAVDRAGADALAVRAREEATSELRRLANEVAGSDRPSQIDLPGWAGDVDGLPPMEEGMTLVPEAWLRETGERVERWRLEASTAKEKTQAARAKQLEAEQSARAMRRSMAGRLAKPWLWIRRRMGQ